jgi:hypothetical protein
MVEPRFEVRDGEWGASRMEDGSTPGISHIFFRGWVEPLRIGYFQVHVNSKRY